MEYIVSLSDEYASRSEAIKLQSQGRQRLLQGATRKRYLPRADNHRLETTKTWKGRRRGQILARHNATKQRCCYSCSTFISRLCSLRQLSYLQFLTRMKLQGWLLCHGSLFTSKAPGRFVFNDGTFPALLKTLSDPAEGVLPRISSFYHKYQGTVKIGYFTSFMVNLLQLFSNRS